MRMIIIYKNGIIHLKKILHDIGNEYTIPA